MPARRTAHMVWAMPSPDEQVAIIGAGVIGCALAYELARRGVPAVLLEAEDELASGASGANSGSSTPGSTPSPASSRPR